MCMSKFPDHSVALTERLPEQGLVDLLDFEDFPDFEPLFVALEYYGGSIATSRVLKQEVVG